MKELSTKQKAKAYDKVREKITLRFGSNVTEEIFSEFEMSEDEKIRKQILSFLKEFERDHYRNIDFSSWIAWLEKQVNNFTSIGVDEMVMKYSQTKDSDFGLPVNCMIRAYRQGINDVLNLLLGIEKQGEQKPNEKVKSKFKVKYAGSEYNVLEIKEIAGVTYYGIEDEPNHIDYILSDNCEIVRDNSYGVKEKGSSYPTKSAIFSEQKPAWSEEDETGLSDALWAIRQAKTIAKDENDMGNLWYAENWLKSLKQRIGG